MKNQNLAFFILLFTTFSNLSGQNIIINNKPEYEPAIVYFTDGTSQRGETKELIDRGRIYITDPLKNFKKIEQRFNMTDKKFQFKTFDQGVITVEIDEVKRVVLNPDSNNNVEVLDLKKIKTIDPKSKEIIETNLTAWVPLRLQGSKMNMYAVNFIGKQPTTGQESLVWTQVYIGNPNEDYVISGIDYNEINLFNIWNIGEIYESNLRIIFKDCPLIIEDIENNSNHDLSKKEIKKYRKELLKKREKLVDSIKKFDEEKRKNLLYKFDSNLFKEPFEKYVKMYNNECQ